jgi:hypothetical protein
MLTFTQQTVRQTLRRLTFETNATEIAEAAAVMPLMFMMILGIFWFGQAFSMYGAITRAAQEGARAGAETSCTTCTASGILPSVSAANAVTAALTASKLDPTKAQWPASLPPLIVCTTTGGAASCDGRAGNQVCVETPVELTSTVTSPPGAGVCGVAVSFQYPFQFWLPFTSLNKQSILLSAAARMRSENR